MEFDKNRLMNNINILIKNKNLKIGELENELGVSTGYLSRMSKSEKESAPSVDFICKLAAKLEVSIDSLVNGDFQHSNDNLYYMTRFLSSLTEDTDAHKFEWEKFTKYENLQEKYGFSDLPMMTKTLHVNMKEESSYWKFLSTFDNRVEFKMSNINYCAMVSGLGVVLLLKLDAENSEANKTAYELYAIEESSEEQVIPICSTLQNDGAISPAILDLFNCIERHERDVKVSEEARSIIDRYLCRREPEELPFS